MNEISTTFIELGLTILGLALLARLANRWRLSAIPLYLLAGVAFGKGGILPLKYSENFVHLGAEMGIVLLLLMLGLEYTGEELRAKLKTGLSSGIADLLLNFLPGLAFGLLLGWNPLEAWLLGGVTYISSSGVIVKLLADMRWLGNPETPIVMSILVLEDLAMALYLPLTTVLIQGQDPLAGAVSILIALAAVSLVLFIAMRYGNHLSRIMAHESDEIVLLTTLGCVLLVAGFAQNVQVSAAVGAFLVGIAISDPVADHAHHLISPLRDLFAAIFFLFFGLEIDPGTLPPVLLPALVLALITAASKVAAGWWAVARAGQGAVARLRAGVALAARGEFSIVIASLGVSGGLDPRLGTLAAAYVLLLAVFAPVLIRFVEPVLVRSSVPAREN